MFFANSLGGMQKKRRREESDTITTRRLQAAESNIKG